MNLPELAIRKPVTMLMVYLALMLIGVISLLNLPVELYPNVSFGEISIIVVVRGGIPPTEVESLVTKPIEEVVCTVSHLEEMLSVSKEGESTIVLSFEPGTNMDFAALEVREKFAKIKSKLPKEIEKPIIAQFERGDVPIVIVAVISSKRTTEEIRRIVDEKVKERVKRVSGVANVEVGGGRERKILVEVDQRRLSAFSVSIEKVITMLGLNNLNLLSGEVEREKDKYIIRAMGSYETLSDIQNIAITSDKNNSVVRLKDLALVKDSYLEPSSYARMNIRPVVSLYIQKESKDNTIRVAEKVLKELDEVKKILPSDIKLIVTSNQSEFIKTSVNNLKDSILRGSFLVVLVLLLFLVRKSPAILLLLAVLVINTMFLPIKILSVVIVVSMTLMLAVKNLRSVLIVTSAIPISVIITFVMMRFTGLTINFMTLFGLALGVGMLVDNSIVVFENILAKKEAGNDLRESAVLGSSEVLVAIIASTLSTVIVFLPMVFVGEEIRLLYGGVAWTVTYSLLISMVVAVTVIPLMAVKLGLHIDKDSKTQGRFIQVFDKNISGFAKIIAGRLTVFKKTPKYNTFSMYKMHRKIIAFFIRRRYIFIIACAGLFLLSLFLFSRLGKEYLGTTEQNRFTVFIELPTGARLEASDAAVKKVEQILKAVPEVKTISSRVEAWSSKVYVELVGVTDRKRSVQDVIDSIRPKVARIHPAFIYFEEEKEVGTKELIIDVFGYDYDKLRELAVSMASRLGNVKGLTDVKIRMREGRPELGIEINRDEAGVYNLTVNDIAMTVHAQMRGLRATLFHTEGREIETIGRLQERYRRTFKDLHRLVIFNKEDDQILLDQVSQFKYGLGPSEVWRKDKSRMVQVSANIGKIPLSKAAENIKSALSDLKMPKDYFYRLGGNYPTMVAVNKQFRAVIWLVLALVFIVLASLYESYYQPFIIMVSVPLGIIGSALILFFTGTAVGMGVLIGMMMLAGIVVNNAILLVDHTNHLRRTGNNLIKASMIASKDRMRPIMMTTSTTVIGLIPMALDRSEGANLWSPLAITVIGGLTVSTVFTIFMVPCIYLAFEEFIPLITKIASYPSFIRQITKKSYFSREKNLVKR